ncbi:MAG TPA: hypothetical protein VML75_14745 [Kofleriaceae bacterium]|nr:hypothetical protein [Kofleriaceae bacterium]
MQAIMLGVGYAERVPIEVCGPCGAGLFDYFAAEPGSIARALSRCAWYPPAAELGLHRLPACPHCDSELLLLPYLEDGPLLYRCDDCLIAFATARQLRLLAEFEHTRKAAITIWAALGERLGVL